MTTWQERLLGDCFVEAPDGPLSHNGKWYDAKFGCDLIGYLDEFISEERKAVALEVVERMKEITCWEGWVGRHTAISKIEALMRDYALDSSEI